MCYSFLVDTTSVTFKNLAFPEEPSNLSTLPHPWSVLHFFVSYLFFVVWKEPCQESSHVCNVGMLTLLFLATSLKFFFTYLCMLSSQHSCSVIVGHLLQVTEVLIRSPHWDTSCLACNLFKGLVLNSVLFISHDCFGVVILLHSYLHS